MAIEVDERVTSYQAVIRSMQAIIDTHMKAAFFEIHHEYGITPCAVSLRIAEAQDRANGCMQGLYISCDASLGVMRLGD